MSISSYAEREKRSDARAGVLAALMVNIANRGAKPRPRDRKPEDFFPSLKAPRRQQTPQDQLGVLMALAQSGKSTAQIKHVPRDEFQRRLEGMRN